MGGGGGGGGWSVGLWLTFFSKLTCSYSCLLRPVSLISDTVSHRFAFTLVSIDNELNGQERIFYKTVCQGIRVQNLVKIGLSVWFAIPVTHTNKQTFLLLSISKRISFAYPLKPFAQFTKRTINCLIK